MMARPRRFRIYKIRRDYIHPVCGDGFCVDLNCRQRRLNVDGRVIRDNSTGGSHPSQAEQCASRWSAPSMSSVSPSCVMRLHT